jgi:hypothetical protein
MIPPWLKHPALSSLQYEQLSLDHEATEYLIAFRLWYARLDDPEALAFRREYLAPDDWDGLYFHLERRRMGSRFDPEMFETV